MQCDRPACSCSGLSGYNQLWNTAVWSTASSRAMTTPQNDLLKLLELLHTELTSPASPGFPATPQDGPQEPPGAPVGDILREAAGKLLQVAPLTPELRAWAQSRLTDDEIAEAVRATREQGGATLGDVIRELEQERNGSEHRPNR